MKGVVFVMLYNCARFFALINIAIVICGVVFIIPGYAVGGGVVRKWMESKNSDQLIPVIERFRVTILAYEIQLLISFVFLIISAIFLWKLSKPIVKNGA